MRLLLSFIFLLITVNLIGQETKFSKQELTVDLDSLVSYIEQVHLNPYTCISRKQFSKEIELCKKNLADSTSIIKYFTLISPIVGKINDDHTAVAFPYDEWKTMNPYCFPFNPKISNKGKMFVPVNQSQLPQNAEILSINGISAKIIVNKLISSISGESKNFRLSCLEKSFVERFGAYYGYKTSYIIKYETGKKKTTLTMSGIKLTDLLEFVRKKRQTVQKTGTPRFYEYRTLNNGKTGIIDFNSFSDINKFTLFVDSVFSKIKQEKTENLIIDLRSNGGGDSALGDELFQWISKVPFTQFGQSSVKYSRIRAQYYTEFRNSLFLKNFKDNAFNMFIAPQYGTIKTSIDTLNKLRDNPLRFNGNVYLLTSTNTFSSASHFAWCFKHFNMGKVIGEETGGNIVCFGDLINTTLPFTKLLIFISHKEFYGYGATSRERHGVIPNYKVVADKALDFTLKLLDKAPKP